MVDVITVTVHREELGVPPLPDGLVRPVHWGPLPHAYDLLRGECGCEPPATKENSLWSAP